MEQHKGVGLEAMIADLPDPIRERVLERIKQGDSFGPPRSKQKKVNVREFVEQLK